jgi:hypothetical protein
MLSVQDITNKWADWCIRAVRMDPTGHHIETVLARTDNGSSLGKDEYITRAAVVRAIEGGTRFCTIYQRSDGKWVLGAHVEVITIYGSKYLRTDADRTTADNLGQLPRF